MYSFPVVSSRASAPSLAGLFDALVDEAWSLPAAVAAPRSDVYTDRQKYYLDIELPGVKKSNVHVKVESNVLHVSAERTETETKFLFIRRERPVGKVEQSFRLGDNLDVEKLEASFEDGLLHIEVPLKTAALGREIAVK